MSDLMGIKGCTDNIAPFQNFSSMFVFSLSYLYLDNSFIESIEMIENLNCPSLITLSLSKHYNYLANNHITNLRPLNKLSDKGLDDIRIG